MTPYYTIKDHLGSVRTTVNASGAVIERNDYYPFGQRTTFGATYATLAANRQKFSGKEEQTAVAGSTLPYLDFGARMYDAKLVRWNTYDPMAEKYYGINPYVYCAGDPVNAVDPEGRKIRGLTSRDARTFRDDIHTVLSDDKFANVRSLIDIKGRTFNSIDPGKMDSAMKELGDDEKAYITMITNVINSPSLFTVEYVSGKYTSMKGANAFRDHMNKTAGNGIGDLMVDEYGRLSSEMIKRHGNGLNVPTSSGSHSFIIDSLQGSERAITSGHEVFGHGIPSARQASDADNNANAIRTDNLIRRIMALPQRDGSDHSGFKEGYITNPYSLPIIK